MSYKLLDKKDLTKEMIVEMATCGVVLDCIETIEDNDKRAAARGFVIDYMERYNCRENSLILHMTSESAKDWLTWDNEQFSNSIKGYKTKVANLEKQVSELKQQIRELKGE